MDRKEGGKKFRFCCQMAGLQGAKPEVSRDNATEKARGELAFVERMGTSTKPLINIVQIHFFSPND